MLFQPAGNAKADLPHMEMLLNTYGKTWHTWQVDRGDKLPLGTALLQFVCQNARSKDPAAWHAVAQYTA